VKALESETRVIATVAEGERYVHRYLISLSSRAMELMNQNVGFGKRFATKSQCVNYCVMQQLGSEQVKQEDRRERLRRELHDTLDALVKLKAKQRQTEDGKLFPIYRARILSTVYGIPLDDTVTLAEKAEAEWKQHWDPTEKRAIWPAILDGEKYTARYEKPEHILPDLLAAVEIRQLEQRIQDLKTELKRS
jgi:hypothetical protein